MGCVESSHLKSKKGKINQQRVKIMKIILDSNRKQQTECQQKINMTYIEDIQNQKDEQPEKKTVKNFQRTMDRKKKVLKAVTEIKMKCNFEKFVLADTVEECPLLQKRKSREDIVVEQN